MITLRKYFLWSSHWFCDFNYYNLLFEDIKITNYLQSIFSSLKYPTSNFIIKRYFYKIIVQSTFYILFFYKQRLKRNKLFYYFRKHKRYLINHFLLKKSAYFLFKKISNKIYFFFFKFRRFKINYFKQFYVNVPIIDYKNMSSYSFFCNLNWNVNRLFFFKLINMQHALSIKPCFLTIFKLKNDLSHLYLNNIKACYYNSLYVYIDVFFSKHYWFSKCFNFIGKNSALLKKIKNKFNFFKSNIYDYFYKNNIDISSIHKRDTFLTDHSSENIQLKKKMNININNINNQNSINKQTFSSTIVNIYDYSLSYLFNNNLNKAFMLDLFKREKYFLIYTFLITNNYIVFNNNNFFNSSNYFVWYFFIHKYHLHFYNKLHYYVSENNFSYKYSRIYYYYSLIGYRINKLSFFLGFYKITLRDFSIKKIIDLILGINLKFDNNITSINLFNCKNTIIRKYDHHFRSLIGLINYIKILSNSTKTSSLIDSKKKIYKIAKKRYKKEYKNVPFMGFNNIIKKLYFYNKKKRLIEKKLIHFIIKKKKIRFDNSYLFNNYTSIFISYNNIKIGKNTFSISNNYRVNKFRIQIIKLNNKINILKKLNKYVSSKHININLFTYNKKNKLRLTFLDKHYMYINNSNISLRWFDFYHHYFYYTNKVHNMKSLFDMRMSVKSKSVNLDNQYKNIKKVNRNIFNNTRKYYSTLLYRKKRRNLLKRLLKRNKNNYLYSLSNDTIDLKKNSKYSKPIYYNNQNNFSRVQYYHIYKNYRYYFKKWYHSKKNIESFNSFRNLISHISKNVNIKKNINTRKKNRKENNYTNTKIRDYKNNRRETTFNKNRISNNQSTDNINTNVSNPINNTNNLLYIYSNYIIYNLIFKKKFHLVYNNIYLNKYILLSRWSSIKCINFIIGNYFINKNKNSLLLSILKKTMSFLHSKINACKLIHLKKRYFVLSPIRFNYFSTLLWFSFMINNFDIISIVKESKIDNNIFIWSKYMCHMSFLNDYLLSSSIFYIFSKSTKNNYINKVLNVYIDNKIVNRFIVLKKKINNRLKRVKYKFYYIANNKFNTENTFSFTSTKTHTNEIYKSLHTNNVGINFFLYNKMYKLYYSVNKSFISQDIMLYNRLSDLILMVLKTLKYYSYIYAKNIFLFSLPLDLFNQLIYFSNSIFSYSTNVVRLISIFYNNYYIYFEKVFSIDYLNTSILRSLLKNKSYYLYYTKYYLLNFLYLIYYIEISISEYSNNNCFLFINYSLRLKYYSNSAKMWCEYIAYYLRKKFKIWKLFWLIKKQQRIEKNKILYDFSSDRRDNIFLHSYKYPLRGIRITYSGNLKKAKRKRKLYYYVWLSDSRYTGKMPLKKFKYYIDYYSISVPLKRSSIGIKFWLLFDIH